MGKVLTVVGARPQFIKAAALSRVLRKTQQEILVHTGQHFDANMSDVFFEELEIPKPDYNLGISGGSHANMTAKMLIAIEEVLLQEKPDLLLIYGDTNSTLAAALAAVKLHIPIAHVESGNRVGILTNPEEVNRIVADHLSTLRFACVDSAMGSMEKENLLKNAHLVGDPMLDAFLFYQDKAKNRTMNDLIGLDGAQISLPEDYCYLTCHRQENSDDVGKLEQILNAMEGQSVPTIYPVHPRNREAVQRLQQKRAYHNILFTQPLGYLSSIALVSGAQRVVTDSGGVQREAFFAGVPCVTVLDFVCWPETMVSNRNLLATPDAQDIMDKLTVEQLIDPAYQPFGDGHACEKIVHIIDRHIGIGRMKD